MEDCVERIEVIELLSYIGHELRGVLQILTLSGSGIMGELIRRETEPAFRKIEKLLDKMERAISEKTPKMEEIDIVPIIKSSFKNFTGSLPPVNGDKKLIQFSFRKLSEFAGENSKITVKTDKDVNVIELQPEKDLPTTRLEIMSSFFPEPLFSLKAALRILERHGWHWSIKNGKITIKIYP